MSDPRSAEDMRYVLQVLGAVVEALDATLEAYEALSKTAAPGCNESLEGVMVAGTKVGHYARQAKATMEGRYGL